MKVALIQIGKANDKDLDKAILAYANRLKHYIPFESILIPSGKGNQIEEVRQHEEQAILKQIQARDKLVLLDEYGSQWSSTDFAGFLQQQMNLSTIRLVFVIGGAHGFTKNLLSKADFKMGLSHLTFPHQLVRLIFTEQLYRAMTIIKGESYHHGTI